jgi:photosystem II stability/assembly factor-like uncharacterized protein
MLSPIRHLRRYPVTLVALVMCAAAISWPVLAEKPSAPAADLMQAPAGLPPYVNLLQWRSLGPDRGGRSLAISGVVGRPNDAYFGAVGGGLWKTTDRGENWFPVTDGQVGSASVGAVAVSETNPDIVFIGMGETCIRGNIQSGDGVYKSTDAGKTWTHVGFRDAKNISKIRIHPTNPDIVYVAAFGHHAAPNEERGVFKSIDGGKTWKRTLFRDAKTAAIDLSIDPKNPNVIYAGMWEAYRLEYQMSSGGPGSGLFKSTDAGETWTEITRAPGMPTGLIGRVGVSVSPANSNRVYAVIENENGGLFRSDDAGATWKQVNSGRNIRQRAFYYTHVTADPVDADTVYVLNVGTFKSTDGGVTMASFTGGDSHDLWIDPKDPKHIVHASDTGGAVTYTGGNPFTARDIPTPQYYHVVTTKHVPYHVCGAQQDGNTVCIPNELGGTPAAATAMYNPGGFEPGYIAPDPKDVDVFYAGAVNGSWLDYTNRRTGQSREVHPYPRMFSGEPSSALVERIQWTFPIIFSPVDTRVLYTATQHVWRTTNGGQSWDRISGDLSRHDPKTMGHSGGPITGDMNGPEVYATVFALAPGKTDVNVLWAGSDDGLIHVTRDGGKNWTNVTPKDMPDFGRVSIIDASSFDAATAYVAVKRPLLDDFAPYIFKTNDFGRTWTKIVNGIAADEYVHTVREDPKRRGLLYAGTQEGVHMSYDDGATWLPISLNLPNTQVSDLIVEDRDLVISTHGRGFYVLDDIAPLRQWSPAVASATPAYLFAPETAYRSTTGATVRYLVNGPVQSLTIDVLDKTGAVVQSFAGAAPAAGGRGAAGAGGRAGTPAGGGGRGGGRGGGGTTASMGQGMQTVTWNLRYPPATSFPGMILWGGNVQGPFAAPGTYQVRMTVNGVVQTQPFQVAKHPMHTDVTDADLQEQFDLVIKIRDKTSEANQAVIDIRRIKADVADRVGKSPDPRLKAAGDRLVAAVSEVEGEIYQVKNQSGQDPLNFPIKVNNRLASLMSMINIGDGKPIGNAQAIFTALTGELKVLTDSLDRILAKELAGFNTEATRLKLDPVKGR